MLESQTPSSKKICQTQIQNFVSLMKEKEHGSETLPKRTHQHQKQQSVSGNTSLLTCQTPPFSESIRAKKFMSKTLKNKLPYSLKEQTNWPRKEQHKLAFLGLD